MSVLEIVAIVVGAAVILLALSLALSKEAIRRRATIRRRERELGERRKRLISEHRSEAASHYRKAEIAEQRARIAEQEARRELAAAELREQRAVLHEQRLADDELIEDHERDEFAGTSAVPGTDAWPTAHNDRPEPAGARREA